MIWPGIAMRLPIVIAATLILTGSALSCGAPMDETASPQVELGGDREHQYQVGPVYRRFNQMTVYLRGMDRFERGSPTAAKRLLVTKQPKWDDDPRARRLLVDATLDELPITHNGGAIYADATLGSPARPLPVGRYRVDVHLDDGDRVQQIDSRRTYVIFNAHHPADRSVHHPAALQWLDENLDMVRQRDDDLITTPYDLDLYDPELFKLAIAHVEGAMTGRAAAERAVPIAVKNVDGYWPALADEEGDVPDGAPGQDPDWQHREEYFAATERLEAEDQRGQCFDYTMLYVAAMRSVGVPARSASVTEPAPVAHPYALNHQVTWDYHVWPEVFLDGDWRASDVTYLDEDLDWRSSASQRAGLQSREGDWFEQMMDDEAEVWILKDDQKHQITEQYDRDRRRMEAHR